MQNRPSQVTQHKNRIQYETSVDGGKIFLEYWIHEWDGKGYELNERISDLDKAIKKAEELGYNGDAIDLGKFK